MGIRLATDDPASASDNYGYDFIKRPTKRRRLDGFGSDDAQATLPATPADSTCSRYYFDPSIGHSTPPTDS